MCTHTYPPLKKPPFFVETVRANENSLFIRFLHTDTAPSETAHGGISHGGAGYRVVCAVVAAKLHTDNSSLNGSIRVLEIRLAQACRTDKDGGANRGEFASLPSSKREHIYTRHCEEHRAGGFLLSNFQKWVAMLVPLYNCGV